MLKKYKLSATNWVSNHRKRFSENKKLRKLTMCKKCYTFYYKKSWHFDKPMNVKIGNDEEIPVRFTECAACLDQDSAFYDMKTEFVVGA